MRNAVYSFLLTATFFIGVSGCDQRTPQQKHFDVAVEHLLNEQKELTLAEKDQNFIERLVPGMESEEVKLRRERVEEDKQKVKEAAKGI
jgi:hypothetical protein